MLGQPSEQGGLGTGGMGDLGTVVKVPNSQILELQNSVAWLGGLLSLIAGLDEVVSSYVSGELYCSGFYVCISVFTMIYDWP